MKQPVSIVVPSLFDPELFDQSLPPLLAELERRDLDDEVLVVDDTGEGLCEPWLAKRYPTVRTLSREENGGYGKALAEGVAAARHALVFCMNPDVVVHEGFLEPLVACLAKKTVHSAVPRILLHGDPERIESVTEIRVRTGLGEVGQPGLEGRAAEFEEETVPVAYAIGGACLLRRDEFVASGCDPLYEPFYWEDVDVGWNAWRQGREVLYAPASVVEHHHRGTIGRRVDEDMVRAMIEKNRLLFQWKFLDTEAEIEEHLAALYRSAVDAWMRDDRQELIWLALALDQLDEVRASREALPAAERTFAEIRALISFEEG
jgi:GT2 family glycosyltransferase